jgi:hypothetical protein
MKILNAIMILILFCTLAFGCPPTPPKPNPQPNPVPVMTVTNTNINTNNNTNNNTNSVYTNQSQAQSQAQAQSQTATGGDASASSAASNNGNGSNNNTTNVEASKIPVNTAYAPSAFPTVPCFKGYSGGAQVAQAGVSFGGGKIDPNCAILETARSLALAGSHPAYCQVMATDKYVKAAYGKNIQKFIDDCMYQPPQPAPEPQPIVQVAPQPMPQIVVVPVTIPTPVPTPVLAPPEYRTNMVVTPPVKKRTVHHLPPNCQNVMQIMCKDGKK